MAYSTHPSRLQITMQASLKPVAQTILRVSELLSGGVRGDIEPAANLPRRRLFGQVFVKRRFGRAFLVDAKRAEAWKSLVAHYFRLGGSEEQRTLVSRTGWVAVVVEVVGERQLFGMRIHDLRVESPNGVSNVSLVTS